MDLEAAYDLLNFWVNKNQGEFFPPEELDLLVDRGQMSLYSDYQPKYGTSDRVNTSLSPFKTTYTYTNGTSVNGAVQIPLTGDDAFVDFIDMQGIIMDENNVPRTIQMEFPNDDERTGRINSQIIPLTTSNPFAEWIGKGKLQLWPKVPQAGIVTYFRRPKAPFFSYTLVSGRVIVYDPNTSVQLEWLERDQNAVLIKALESIGINISEQDIQQFAETKAQQNFQGVNRT